VTGARLAFVQIESQSPDGSCVTTALEVCWGRYSVTIQDLSRVQDCPPDVAALAQQILDRIKEFYPHGNHQDH
jgi:hypothetical protein